MTEENQRSKVTCLLLLLAAIAAAGCTSSAPEGTPSSQDVYLDAYCQGIDHHLAGQDFLNNGTGAWENMDFQQAIADYANASTEYDAAARCYGVMSRHAADAREREFADALWACADNLSLASDDFMNTAIAVESNDTEAAYERFYAGQARMDASDQMLNRSVGLVPLWLEESLASQ